MKRNKNYFLILLMAVLLLSCTDHTAEKTPPQITAQGFAIDKIQEGSVGAFGHLRLRIESDGRIKELHIRERSYDVDLATTPERQHFGLFGIDKRAVLRKDVTLDFQNYINQKLNQPGQYTFKIKVVDKQGQATQASLIINLVKPKNATTPIESSRFQMQRQGKGAVAGAEPFGITWKTIDNIKVTIQVTKGKNGASKLASLSRLDYEQLSSKEALSEKINAAKGLDSIEFDTANNAAAGQVLGISKKNKYYLLKTEQSHTTLSYAGTIVSINGEYKF